MPPKKDPMSQLFHPKPKKPLGANGKAVSSPAGSAAPSPRPRPVPLVPADEEVQIPDGPFSEFTLVSSSLNGWKYDVMKFDSRKTVDITKWNQPLKLNRKELRRHEGPANDPLAGATPMIGADGQFVYRQDGTQALVDKTGKAINPAMYNKPKDPAKGARRKMQKKTKQVFTIPDEQRQLKKDERYPWILEDASKKEVWVGRLDDAERSDTQAFFMPAVNNTFKFVPSHRWYKFQKRPNHYVPTLEEAEDLMAKQAKDKDPQTWLLRNRGQAPSSQTAAIFKAEAEGRTLSDPNSLVIGGSGPSFAAGGRRLKAVSKGGPAYDDPDDDDRGEGPSSRRAKRDTGQDGDFDEQEYETEHSDDEEDIPEEKDEEEKEVEERLKKEYQKANKDRDAGVDDSDSDLDDEPILSKDGKAMRKLLTAVEKNTAYESDEEGGNPYVSEEEEEEPEPPLVPLEPPTSSRPTPKAPIQQHKPALNSRPTASNVSSRATSPSLGKGGHSIVAQRATSPKIPSKLKTSTTTPRSTSPLSHTARSLSPTSPAGSREGSPSLSNKRKAVDDVSSHGLSQGAGTTNGSSAPAPVTKKKRKNTVVATPAPDEEMKEEMLIEWLRHASEPSPRDAIVYFTPYLTNQDKKRAFIGMMKKVALQKENVLSLRTTYQ